MADISRWRCPQGHTTQVDGLQRPDCCREHGCGAKLLVMDYAGAEYQRHPMSFREAMEVESEPDPDPKGKPFSSDEDRLQEHHRP